jgi:hypothetical protein
MGTSHLDIRPLGFLPLSLASFTPASSSGFEILIHRKIQVHSNVFSVLASCQLSVNHYLPYAGLKLS